MSTKFNSDNANGRIFTFTPPGNPNNTVESCVKVCSSLNYTIAGLEFGGLPRLRTQFAESDSFYPDECFCANNLVNGATTTDGADCSMGCVGNTTFVGYVLCASTNSDVLDSEACGGPNRLSVYSSASITAFPVPTALTTDLPGQWQYKGCLRWAYRFMPNTAYLT